MLLLVFSIYLNEEKKTYFKNNYFSILYNYSLNNNQK